MELLGPTTELVVVNCSIKSTFRHVRIQSRNGLLLLNKRRQHFKMMIFFICVSSRGTQLLSFFTIPICFKCQMTGEWSTLSSLAASHVVGWALIIAFYWLLSTSNGLPLFSSSSRLLSPMQDFLKHHCTVHSLAVSGPDAWLMLRILTATLQPILNSSQKIT